MMDISQSMFPVSLSLVFFILLAAWMIYRKKTAQNNSEMEYRSLLLALSLVFCLFLGQVFSMAGSFNMSLMPFWISHWLSFALLFIGFYYAINK